MCQTGRLPLTTPGWLGTQPCCLTSKDTGRCSWGTGGTGATCGRGQVKPPLGTGSARAQPPVSSQVTPGKGQGGGVKTEAGRIRMWLLCQFRGQPSSAEGQTVNTFSFADHAVLVAATQLCRQDTKAATHGVETRERGCVPAKLSLWTTRSNLPRVRKYSSSFDCFQPLHIVKTIILAHGGLKTGGGPDPAHSRGWLPPARADVRARIHKMQPRRKQERLPGRDETYLDMSCWVRDSLNHVLQSTSSFTIRSEPEAAG